MRKAVEIPVYATVRLCSANSRTASTCSRFTPGNHRRKSSTPAPSSRFSKRAFTGTRVPLNSHTSLIGLERRDRQEVLRLARVLAEAKSFQTLKIAELERHREGRFNLDDREMLSQARDLAFSHGYTVP